MNEGMAGRNDQSLPPELLKVEERLRADIEGPSSLELDRTKLRARARARRTQTHALLSKGNFMRTRLLVAALLTLGLLFTFSGAIALAEHTPEHENNAGAQQYGPDDDDDGGGGGGDDDGGGGGGDDDGGGGFDDGVGDGGGDGDGGFDDGGDGGLSAGDQSGADDGNGLANTGFLAIPLLLLGVGMFGAGAFVGVRARKE
jgi:hypothetical protein